MEIIKNDVESIIHNKVILEKLSNNGIKTIEELCGYSQKELQEKQIENYYIKDIIIALQSNGLDLKKSRKKR